IVRHAIVRPRGIVGATVSGFYAVTPTTNPERTRVFHTVPLALRWLGRTGSAAAGLETEMEAMVTAATAVPQSLQAVRALLAARPSLHIPASDSRAVGSHRPRAALQKRLLFLEATHEARKNRDPGPDRRGHPDPARRLRQGQGDAHNPTRAAGSRRDPLRRAG